MINGNEVRVTGQMVLDFVTQFYLESRDFNGVSFEGVQKKFDLDPTELIPIIINLINTSKLSLNFGDIHPNPHIKAFEEEDSDIQVKKLKESNLKHVCIYPLKSHLSSIVDKSDYVDKPFTLRLALGEPQLSLLTFDITILEFYRNDPRYYYSCDNAGGRIHIRDEHYNSKNTPEPDKILLKEFGFSYDDKFNRAVSVFLTDLAVLTPKHQKIWDANKLTGNYKIHPEFWATAMGHFPEGISIFSAFIIELQQINEICKLIGRPVLFKKDFAGVEKPKELSFIIRPTSKEYYDFAHFLDKLISENINKEFFLDDINFEYEEIRKDGKIIITQKNTITILHEWLNKVLTTKNTTLIDDMIKTFKKIRDLRHNPAHKIDDNIFDKKYFQKQKDLVENTYNAIRTLRLILINHPKAKYHKVPDYLQKGKIWIY